LSFWFHNDLFIFVNIKPLILQELMFFFTMGAYQVADRISA